MPELGPRKIRYAPGSCPEVLSVTDAYTYFAMRTLAFQTSENKLNSLCDVMRAQSFEDGTYIIEQEDEGRAFTSSMKARCDVPRNKAPLAKKRI